MLNKVVLIIVIAIGAVAAAPAARAQELGLTPNHVVSLWTDTNDALVVVAGVISDDEAWVDRLAATTARSFSGKAPADVLERVAAFRDKLDRLRRSGGLEPTQRYDNGGGAVTPSVVFLNSGHVLDAVVSWIIENTGREQLVSGFYTRHGFSGKTPSDAFAMVDLANRRIDLILEKASG